MGEGLNSAIYRTLSIFFAVGLGIVQFGCRGFDPVTGAPVSFQAGGANPYANASPTASPTPSPSSTPDCHFTVYKATVGDSVHSKCVTCHGSGAGGVTLQTTISGDASYLADYTELRNFIDTSDTASSATVLLRNLTQGSDLNHALQFTVGDPFLTAMDSWITGILTDASCTQGNNNNGF